MSSYDIFLKFIERKVVGFEWELWGVSRIKFIISLIPLMSKKVATKKEWADELGVSYNVLRKFLSEEKVRKIVATHAEHFSRYYEGSCEGMEEFFSPMLMERINHRRLYFFRLLRG